MKLQAFKLLTLLKESPTQVFSYEYCEMFKNSFYRIPPVAVSEIKEVLSF